MQALKITVGLLLALSYFSACRPDTQIKAKTNERDSLKHLVDLGNDQISENTKTADSLSGLREKQYHIIDLLKDSLNAVVNESPMASTVIYTFDKEPIKMLEDYVAQKTDSAKNAWLGSRIIMAAYAQFDSSQETMRMVRVQMNRFDSETRACRSVISLLDEQISKNNRQIKNKTKEISLLDSRIEQLNKEIETLNHQGIL